jgi:hypothetical protein
MTGLAMSSTWLYWREAWPQALRKPARFSSGVPA